MQSRRLAQVLQPIPRHRRNKDPSVPAQPKIKRRQPDRHSLPRPALLGSATLLCLAGCAVGPNYHRPATPTPPRYTNQPQPDETASVATEGGASQHFTLGRDIAGAWWSLYRSPELTRLVATALRDNQNLEAARQTLRQAQENALAAKGGFLPQLGGSFNRVRQEISGAEGGLSPTLGAFSETYTVYTAQLSVNYTFDVWGQTRRQVEAQQAAADYQRFQLEAAVNTLAANTVTTAINAAALRDEITAEEALIGAEQHILNTVKQQFELGGATGTDVATQEAQLATTEAAVVPLQTQLAQARDQLAAYLGLPPSALGTPDVQLDKLILPGELPVSLPSSLVAQRPDIRASEAQLQQATAQLGVAISNRLPQVTLSAFVGSAPGRIGDLFTPGNGIWGLTNQIAGPLFQGGTLLHQQRAAAAAMRAATANYRNTVITAFQNVADVLTALAQDAKALAANQDEERAAARSLSLARLQYEAGGAAYLTVLTAQTQYQNAVIGLIRARAARYADTAALFAALGGGWWHRNDLPPPPEGFLRSLLP
jgi:NodT family efflux transporter outer membrane factor (OMF) lipoprotein